MRFFVEALMVWTLILFIMCTVLMVIGLIAATISALFGKNREERSLVLAMLGLVGLIFFPPAVWVMARWIVGSS